MSTKRECRLFPKCTEDDRAHREEFSSGALLWVTFLGHARKVTVRREGSAARPAYQHEDTVYFRHAAWPSDELPKKIDADKRTLSINQPQGSLWLHNGIV